MLGKTDEDKIKRVLPQRPNPAMQSAKKFGSMVKENVLDPVASGVGFPGRVIAGTVNQAASGLESLGNTIKENYNKERDYSQLAKSPLDPTNPYGNNYSPEAKPVPGMSSYDTPTPEQIQQSLNPVPIRRLPEGNQDALNGINQIAPPVGLAETATEQPGYVSPEGVAALRDTKDLTTNQAKQNVSDRIPDNYIATVDGWKPKQDVLPGNSFNKENTEDYFKQTGYIPDNDPRMIKRRQEAQDVQAKRLEFIANSQAGLYGPGGTGPTTSTRRSIATADRASAERIADARNRTDRELNQIKRDYYTGKNQNTSRGTNVSDQIDNIKQGKEFAQDFTLRGFPELSLEIGQEVYDQANSTGLPIVGIKDLLAEELMKLKTDNPDADFSKNSPEIISLLKERIRHEQSR